MMGYLLRWILLLWGLFLLPVLLIRAQPYDDSELRAFLTPPEGCPAPCFMGIRPGVTTVEEVTAILGQSKLFRYRMNPSAPDNIFLRTNAPHDIIVDINTNALRIENRIVEEVEIQTNISLAELWVTYGQPDWGFRAYSMGSSRIHYAIGYNQDVMDFQFYIHIESGSYAFQHVLREKLTLRLGSNMRDQANMHPTLWQYTNPDLSWWDCC